MLTHHHVLLHSGHLVEERLRQRLKPLGIQPRQARILNVLNVLGQASQADLARRFNVTAASMSTMTCRLIKAGFIAREPGPAELRTNSLTLTDSGRDMLDAIHEAWDDVDRVIEEAIGPEQAKALGELTLALRDALGGRAPADL
ncbi:MarR family transcriptional regulator [Algihabitans albus]|uniref:MarR family winged helix-turn-helix transcriptional regulator n=1 Tax=Algihabitans albus TaxID=2164067 RepID=UPI0035D04891